MGPTRPRNYDVDYGRQKLKKDEQPGIWDRMMAAVQPAPAQAEKTYKPFSPEHEKAAREELTRYFSGK